MSVPGQPADDPARRERTDLLTYVAGAALVAVAVLVVVLAAGGGAPQPVPAGLPDSGPVTGWGLPVARVVADLAGIVTVGLLLAAAVLVPSPAARLVPVAGRGTQVAVRSATAWAAAVVVELLLTLSDVLGVPPAQALDASQLRSFVAQVPQGRALVAQLVLVLAVAGLARVTLTIGNALAGTVLALLAMAPPALTGHSASTGSHDLAVASLLVHVVAVSAWVGGLAGLAWVGFHTGSGRRARRTQPLRHAVPRFSVLAGWCYVAVAASGILNAGVRLGGWAPLATSSYGVLVLAKAAALGVLGGFGWWHRKRTVAGLRGASTGATGPFVRVAAVELVVMTATVALAVGLSRTPTPVPESLDVSPATDLLGFPMPPAPGLLRLLTGWVPDGFALTFLALAALLYGVGLHVQRRRREPWPAGRVVAWYAGLLVVAWATLGGLGVYSHVLFSAHLAAHLVLGTVAPVGLVLGAPVALAARTLPGPRVPDEQGLRDLLRDARGSRWGRLSRRPAVVLLLVAASLFGVYLTALFPALMRNHLGHVAMEAVFLGVGCLLLRLLLDPADPAAPPRSRAARAVVPLAAAVLLVVFCLVVAGRGSVLAPGYFEALHRPYARDLLADQHLGALLAGGVGAVAVVLVAGVLVGRRFTRGPW